jgi:hypothetical protein
MNEYEVIVVVTTQHKLHVIADSVNEACELALADQGTLIESNDLPPTIKPPKRLARVHE